MQRLKPICYLELCRVKEFWGETGVVSIIEKGNTYNRIVWTAGKSALELCDAHMIRENASFVNAGLVFQSLDFWNIKKLPWWIGKRPIFT
jgi:hypothetical protein